MKKIRQIILLVAASLVTQAAMADTYQDVRPSPFDELQAQLDALDARTQALEDAAPTSDIEGRTYCSTLELSVTRGVSFNASEQHQTNIIRRTATFSGGAFTGSYLSNVLNNLTDDGVVEHPAGAIIDPLLATYVQTGSKLDVTFSQGFKATWYVSKDGSLIHGMKISHEVFAGGAVTVGFVRNWTLIETDPLIPCNSEDQ